MQTQNPPRHRHADPPYTKPVTASSEAVEFASSSNIENKQIMAAPPRLSPVPQIPSMFNNAQNTYITGGSLNIETVIDNSNTISLSLEVLHKRVALNAILNAGGRADEVRCYSGTREEVVSRIEKWADAQDGHTTTMFWLSGPAGVGKRAIMRTVAERCEKRGVPQANFSFYRGELSRSHALPFIATLLHQIILLYPPLRDLVATMLSTNPLIFDSTFEDQVEQLILTPLQYISQSTSTYRPLLLIIDGLDECDSETRSSQEQILCGLDKILARYNETCPFRVLVASRDESQIQMAFNKLSSQCLCLYLDETYSTENDIRVFVEAQFAEVRKEHRLAHMLASNWPSVNDVDYIIEKSSGQFVFAATVMRFIIGSSVSPAVSLERVRGITPLSTKLQFSHLDAIYTYILSQVDDKELLKDILAARLLSKAVRADIISHSSRKHSSYGIDIRIMDLLRALNKQYDSDVIFSCLEDLTPLIKYHPESGQLLFHHASFSEHLLDQSRSGDYFVDTTAFARKFMQEIWKYPTSRQRPESWVVFSLFAIKLFPQLPLGIMSLLTSSVRCRRTEINAPGALCCALNQIYLLCRDEDDFISYRRFLHACVNKDNIYKLGTDGIRVLPYGRRYRLMARAQRYFTLDTDTAAALRLDSDFDRQELGSWLNELFDCIRTAGRNNSDYHVYLKQWSSWAEKNGIPCRGLEVQLPY